MRDLQPVSIAGIEFDALISEKEGYSADVPEYPVDNGFSVSDNVAIGAMELEMTLYLTATPVTWLSSHGSGENRIKTVCDELLAAYKEREPVTVVTRDKTFSNMVISTISFEKGEDGVLAREIPITLKQITITSSAETEVPAKLAKSGTTKTNKGSAGTTSSGSSSSSSPSGSDDGSSSSDGGSSSSDSGASSIINSAISALTGGSGSGDNRTNLKRLTDTGAQIIGNFF